MLKKKVENPNEEDVIVGAFQKVKEGILTSNWELVCDAYFDLSGERLEPSTPKLSKLETIKQKLASKPTKSKEPKIKENLRADIRPVSRVIETKTKSGLVVISTPENEEEKAINQQLDDQTLKIKPPKRTVVMKDTSSLPPTTPNVRIKTDNLRPAAAPAPGEVSSDE